MPLRLAIEEKFDPFSFVKYIRVIGRAYQRQAIELVTICRLFVEVSPQDDEHDATFKGAILAIDTALRLATKAEKKVTEIASNAFAEAEKILLQYEKSAHPGPSKVDIVGQMAKARATDQRSLRLFNRLLGRRGDETPNVKPTVPVNFVLLKSLPDPEPLIVRQVLSAQPLTSEILWNFSRYKDDRQIPLRQNPHFYLHLPDSFGAEFVKESTKEFLFKRNDKVYVLVDKPDLGRIYLQAENRRRIFGNVWKSNDVLIFKDNCGRLEGEELVENDIQNQGQQGLFWRNERDLSVSTTKPWELQEDDWIPVTDIQDWKELIQEKTLPSTRTSVKICVSHTNPTNEAPRASDKPAVNVSSQRSNVPYASNTTHASSSVHVGSRDTNLEVPPSHSADTRFLPKTQAQTTALGPVPQNGHAHGSQPIAVTDPSMPIPMPTPMSMPTPTPTSLPVHAPAPPITVTPTPMTPSPSPLPGHPSKPPANLESRKNASSPQAPATPRLSPGTNPPSKPTSVAPITNPRHVNPATQPKGPPKSTKSTFTFSTFTSKKFKPPSSMPGAFPGPDMDVDWVMVTEGPADIQGGNWLKRLFRKPG